MKKADLFLAAALALSVLSTAHAAAPHVKTQAPGFYRMMLGDFEITALSDGTVTLNVDQLLTNTTPEQVKSLLAREHLTPAIETSVNAYLINTGSKLVLVDTGAGSLFGPTLGGLVRNLKAAGYQPEQVDVIVITHMHPDHMGGITADGQRVYPNAILRAEKRDVDHWVSEESLAKASEEARAGVQQRIDVVKPYINAGKLQPFEGETEIVPGIRAIPTPGHTPGHTIYVVESKGQRLVLWGDLMHVAAVQFPVPSVTITFDSDSNAARAQREKAYAEAASEGYWVGVAHISFPGLGHVRREGQGYVWVPANYTANRPQP